MAGHIVLVLVVCSLAEPSRCRDEVIRDVPEGVSAYTCIVHMAPPLMAEWQEQHPKKFISRWTCKPLEQVAQGI